jgi:tRNA A37 threonylcarbamoyladenosine dehydratase
MSALMSGFRSTQLTHGGSSSEALSINYYLGTVVIVGCGGSGSALIGGLPFLHQALVAVGQPGLQVIVGDGDRVSATNCVRQPFSESEIGLYKSVVQNVTWT